MFSSTQAHTVGTIQQGLEYLFICSYNKYMKEYEDSL